jgi:hypothetical protein
LAEGKAGRLTYVKSSLNPQKTDYFRKSSCVGSKAR